MKSFLRYCIDADLREMTAPAIKSLRQAKDADEMTHEKRKVPIHADWDDIVYLEQFPPSFWGQALAHRYGKKLFSTEEALSKGKTVEDVEDVVLRYTHGLVLFKKIHTNANKIHDKLTRDVDDMAFAEMEDSDEHRSGYEGGHYGIDLTGGYQHKDKDLQFGEGYIGLTHKQAKNFLTRWTKGMSGGWLGDDPKGSRRISTKKGAASRPVYSFEALMAHPLRGKRFHVTKEGKAQWYGWKLDDEGNPEDDPTIFTEYLPMMLPAKSVDKKSVDAHNRARNLGDVAHSKAEAIQAALEKNPNLSLQQALKMVAGDDWKDYFAIIDPQAREALTKEHEDLTHKLEKQGSARQGQYVSSREQKKIKERLEHIEHVVGLGDAFDQQFGNISKENLPVVLVWVGDELHKEADRIRSSAPRYDAHDWNLRKFSTLKNDPEDPYSGYRYGKLHHKNVIGFGTFHTNKQQKERLHAGVLTRGHHPEQIRDELMPFLVQAGSQSASDDPSDDHIPYVQRRPADPRKLRKKTRLQQEDRRRSPLAIGINRFLQKPSIFGDSAAFIAMKNNWWLIFQNAADDLWGRIGSREFLDYLDAKETDNSDYVEAALQKLEKFAEQVGENYARSIYQIAKRQQQTSLDQPVGASGESLGELLSHEDNKIQDATRKLAYNRALRGAEADFHTTGHDISELKKIIEREAAALAGQVPAPTGDPQNAAQQTNMMRSIIDAGVAFMTYRDYYIWNKIAQKKAKQKRGETTTEEDEWTMQDANAYAAKQVERHNQERGVPGYGGQITAATSRSIKSLADKEQAEERTLRQRIHDAETLGTAQGVKTGEDATVSAVLSFVDNLDAASSEEEKAKHLRSLFTIARSEPPTSNVHDIVRGVVQRLGPDYITKLGVEMPTMGAPTQSQMTPDVQRMLRLAMNPKFVVTLDKNAPQYNEKNRHAFEQWAQHKYPGWEQIQQALERADLGTRRGTG